MAEDQPQVATDTPYHDWPRELLQALRRLEGRYPDGVEMEMLRSHFIYAVAYTTSAPKLTPERWIKAFEWALKPFVAKGTININRSGKLQAKAGEEA